MTVRPRSVPFAVSAVAPRRHADQSFTTAAAPHTR